MTELERVRAERARLQVEIERLRQARPAPVVVPRLVASPPGPAMSPVLPRFSPWLVLGVAGFSYLALRVSR